MKTLLLSTFTLFIISCGTGKQPENKPANKADYTPVSVSLYQEILQQDSLLFEAFNKKNISVARTLFSEDLEFYHDKDGLADYATTIGNLANLFENKNSAELKRELVAGSSEVFPINGYGAVHTGLHTFCHPENGKMDCGTFQFVHLWKKTDSSWKLARVISYDHK